MNILVIAPHADDEVLGCGGLIAKYAKRHDVYVCIVTKPYRPDWSERYIQNREAEIANATRILGVKKTTVLGFHAAKLDTYPQKELNAALQDVVKKIRPQTVFLPHPGDVHKDHRIVFESGLVATRPPLDTLSKILCYETLSETEWGACMIPFVPNVYEDVSGTMDKKNAAMQAYASELREHPHPRSLDGIDAQAKKRGSEAGVPYAEAFHLIREVNG